MGAMCEDDEKRKVTINDKRPPVKAKIIVVGPTQVGKTTMIQTLFSKKVE